MNQFMGCKVARSWVLATADGSGDTECHWWMSYNGWVTMNGECRHLVTS
jgi:hypothetical protein